MDEHINILKEIGNIECKQCGGTCLLDYYGYHFTCQQCGTKYIFESR